MDRQNYVSVWHEDLGLILGGGNSKNQPFFSTFEVIEGRIVRLQADRAELGASDGRDTLRLTYGRTVCEISLAMMDDRRLEISCRAEGAAPLADSVRAGLCLPLVLGKPFRSYPTQETTSLDGLKTLELGWPAKDSTPERWVRVGRLKLTLPVESEFTWPEYPANPYAINNAAGPEGAVAVVSTTLTAGGDAKTFLLSIEDDA
jgi:hypothetical protein